MPASQGAVGDVLALARAWRVPAASPLSPGSLAALDSLIAANWCKTVDLCGNATYGKVMFGSLMLPRNSTLRRAFVQEHHIASNATSWVPDSLRCWRLLVPAVVHAIEELRLSPARRRHQSYYHFGIFQGASVYYYREQFPSAKFLMFDSFIGLPAEQPGELQRATWLKGTFLVREGDIAERLVRDLGGPSLNRVERGFFNESLTAALAASMPGPAALVDVDSDIYISAFQALDWLFQFELVQPGTLVLYDDWMDYTCAPLLSPSALDNIDMRDAMDGMNVGRMSRGLRAALGITNNWQPRFPKIFDGGEPKAHFEIAKKYGVDFRCVAGSCAPAGQGGGRCPSQYNGFGALFIIAGIGGTPNHGFAMSETQLAAWRASDVSCRTVTRTRFTVADDDRKVNRRVQRLNAMVEKGRGPG